MLKVEFNSFDFLDLSSVDNILISNLFALQDALKKIG